MTPSLKKGVLEHFHYLGYQFLDQVIQFLAFFEVDKCTIRFCGLLSGLWVLGLGECTMGLCGVCESTMAFWGQMSAFFVDECTVIFFGVVEYTMVGSY